jgi:hypothetical protein
MSDISMCASQTCNRRTECYRNEASGTEPDPYQQVYFISTDMNENGCHMFFPQHTKKYVTKERDES